MPSVRSLAKLVLVLNLVVSTQGLLMIQGTFALRRDYVVANLCVNRAVPESDCHGRCFLKEQMEQQRKQQERQAAGLEVMLAVSCVLPSAGAVFHAPERQTPSRPLAPAVALTSGVALEVFHPPRVG